MHSVEINPLITAEIQCSVHGNTTNSGGKIPRNRRFVAAFGPKSLRVRHHKGRYRPIDPDSRVSPQLPAATDGGMAAASAAVSPIRHNSFLLPRSRTILATRSHEPGDSLMIPDERVRRFLPRLRLTIQEP